MTGLDVAIIVALLVSALIGVMRGFTKEVLSLFSWGGATALSYMFLPLGREIVHPYIANPMMADGVAVFGLFIVFLIILSILANLMAGYIRETSFKGIDHSLGFGFGILRGVVFISAVELFFSTFWPRQTQSPTIQSARFIPMVRKGGDTLLQVIPVSLRETIIAQATKIENQAQARLQEQLKSEAYQMLPAGSYGGNGKEAALVNPSVGQPVGAHVPSAPMAPQNYPQGMGQSSAHPQTPAPAQQMVVVQSPQPGQPPQLVVVPERGADGNPIVPKETMSTPVSSPIGLGQSSVAQDSQSTADELARLKPRAVSPRADDGYTQRQRDDMARLLGTTESE